VREAEGGEETRIIWDGKASDFTAVAAYIVLSFCQHQVIIGFNNILSIVTTGKVENIIKVFGCCSDLDLNKNYLPKYTTTHQI
jgi:hypothetical protein